MSSRTALSDLDDLVAIFETDASISEEEKTDHSNSSSDLNAEDLANLISNAMDQGKSAFKRLRRELNGDPSLKYSVIPRNVRLMRLRKEVWHVFDQLCVVSDNYSDPTANYERPFVVAVNENPSDGGGPLAVAVFVFGAGDESQCTHRDADLLQARLQSPLGTRMAYGHTHPVFPAKRLFDLERYCMSKRAKKELILDRKFGAFPSNIFIGLEEWQQSIRSSAVDNPVQGILRGQYSAKAASDAVQQLIISPRRYKRHGADYCASLVHAQECCNPDGFGRASEYEFILSPRLRQLGVFHNTVNGECIYTHWVVVT